MSNQFLYEQLDAAFSMDLLEIIIPDSVALNLNPRYELRSYQKDAFVRFFHCFKNKFPDKKYPLHFLFNMATGSGKTLIMAGLILYLYEQGYRNFLFFVNSANIIEKTKDNFLNSSSIKYLFNQDLYISEMRVRITPVENFEAVNSNDINICFTTIQKLHSDLTNEKESVMTFDDFRKHKVVLIADEAHHINVKTKDPGKLFESWENTVERIFRQNQENLLLEFTATHDYSVPAMVEKYKNKVIIRYDLLQFRNDLFSKDVVIVQSDFEQRERILQALILNQYKQEVAAKYRINLKPVILFKAQRTIDQSKQVQAEFHQMIERLTTHDIEKIRNKSDLGLVRRIFDFFRAEGISAEQLAERLRRDFGPDYCISVNDESEKERYQILVNTLEAPQNRIRAIFTVQKLNEGWDVLNLFDIVRCYEARDTGGAKIGTTTMSEAQLIGRGARYFPFVLPASDDRFRRKFDGDLTHELRVLEELHYHSVNDSRYIAEIRQALIKQGMIDPRNVICELKLKEPFTKTNFYLRGRIWHNDRRPKDYRSIKSFSDLGVKKRNYVHTITTGHGSATVALGMDKNALVKDEKRKDVNVKDINRNIIQASIDHNPFYRLNKLKVYFPNLVSMRDFIASDDYLGGLVITFQGNVDGLDVPTSEKFSAIQDLLKQIKAEILDCVTDYEGTRSFRSDGVRKIFTNKTLKFDSKNPRAGEDEAFTVFVSDKDWFTTNTLYGTSEEKAFVRMLDRYMQKLQKQYEQIYLLRNEGHFAIYNFTDGQAFQPDFVLFLHQKNGDLLTYQLFIEPKGQYLKANDKWKEDLLKELTQEFGDEILIFEDKKYRLRGVPFYTNEEENKFQASLDSALEQSAVV